MKNTKNASKKNKKKILNSSKTIDNDYITSQMKNTRYKLNQFYLNKYNEKRCRGDLNYSIYEKVNKDVNYFKKNSAIFQKLNKTQEPTSPPPDANQNYIFEKDLFDNEYQRRLNEFNEKRKKIFGTFYPRNSYTQTIDRTYTDTYDSLDNKRYNLCCQEGMRYVPRVNFDTSTPVRATDNWNKTSYTYRDETDYFRNSYCN